MIRPANHNNRSLLVKVIHELGVEPWLGRADWERVREELDGTNHQVRGWYRRLCSWLESNGYTIEEYAEQETGYPYTRAIGLSGVGPLLDDDEDSNWYALTDEEILAGNGEVSRDFTVPTSFDEFAALTQLDESRWEVVGARSTYWDGRYGWRAQLIPRKTVGEPDFEALVARLSQASPCRVVEPSTSAARPCLLVPCIYDAHLEKLFVDGSGMSETVEAYDYVAAKIAARAQLSEHWIGRVMLVIGQDFGHIDNPQNATSAGTVVATSVGRKFGIDQRTELIVRTVNRFLEVAPVDVIMVSGNHDRDDTYWTGKFVEAWFRNDERVTVNNAHGPRKFYRWGQNLFMFTHGDQEKQADLPIIMSAEAPPEMWAYSTYREVFNGHLHKYQRSYVPLTEDRGVIIRWFSSLSKADDWHEMKGFLGNNRGGFGLIYDEVDRLVNEFPVLL